MSKKWNSAILGLTLWLAVSSSQAIVVNVTPPAPVAAGGTTFANLDLNLGDGAGYFDLHLTMPYKIRLLSIADVDTNDGDALYQRKYWDDSATPSTLYVETSTYTDAADFSTLIGTFTPNGSDFSSFNIAPFIAAGVEVGVRVTNAGADDYSDVKLTFEALSSSSPGYYLVPWEITACEQKSSTGPGCETTPETAKGIITLKVSGTAGTPSIPEPPLALALLGGLLMLVGWRRRA